jgi:oligosaccharide repeat unit polymerase
MVLCTIVPPAVSSIRTNVLHILVGALVAISMARSIQHKARRLKAKNVLIAFIGCYALVQVFYLSVQFSGRVAHYNSPIDYIEYYLAGGIPALDYYLNNGLNPTGISETFWGLQDILQRLGIIASAAQKASEQWSVVNYTYDGVTNIYTFVRPALHDFGYVGMALYMALLGCLFQLLYRAAVTHHSVTSFIVYSYMAYILVESIRDDFFSYWLGLEGIVILVFLLLMKEYVWHTPYDNKRLRRKGMWNRSTNSLKPIRFSDHGDRA